ncbi:hypothetical protein HWI79_2984 [Cryptosporidium felis]|nr:hypothetical protein HWI79_2984 [Cryptosporidium felis]
MIWKPIKGYNELEGLLERVKQIELYCKVNVNFDNNFCTEAEYSKHKSEIVKIYNTAEAILDSLENNSAQHKLLERIKVEELLNRMEVEINKLKKTHRRNTHSFNKFSSANKSDNFLEVEINELEEKFVDTVRVRLNNIFTTENSTILPTSLDDFLSKTDVKNEGPNAKVIHRADRDKLSNWDKMNSRIDSDVMEIGNAALRIADKAEQLAQEAKYQDKEAQEIKALVEFTTNDVVKASRKVQEVIGTNSNATFCCRILLSTLIFVSISIITVLTLKELT